MKIPIFLGLLIALHTNLQAIIHLKQLWKHPTDGHLVLNLGDTHVDDKRSAGQQYDILNLAARTKSRVICEDSCYSIGSYLLATSPVKHLNIEGLHIWARTAGCNSVNIEFRPPYFAEHPFSYAKRVINAADEIESIDDEYTSCYQETLRTFNTSTRQSLQNLRSRTFLLSSARQALQKASNKSTVAKALCSPMFVTSSQLLDMKILQQIAKSRKNNEIAIISAGSWHTRNIGRTLEAHGYACLEEANDPLIEVAEKDGTLDAKADMPEKTYQTFFNPVSIADAHRTVLQHTTSRTPSLRAQATLSYLYARGKIETSPVGSLLYKCQPVPGFIRACAISCAGSKAIFWLGFGALAAGYEIAEKYENFVKERTTKSS